MFLSISTTHRPATDLGFLLRKNPANVHRAELSFGQSIIFYPEAREDHCEAVLMLDIDPIQLVRGRRNSRGAALLDHYVNDRPYAASSFLSVAIARTLRDAMAARAPEREALADTPIPLKLTVVPLPCRGGDAIVRRLFEPLGYEVEAEAALLDSEHPEWGDSRYRTVRLSGTVRLSDALTHLYVLIPVLDNAKHYWIGDDEVGKLIARGGAWLQGHPERDLIAGRYLHRRRYVNEALSLLDEKFGTHEDGDEDGTVGDEETLEKPLRLNDERYEAVTAALLKLGVTRVCDLGCGEGNLLGRLMRQKQFQRIVGFDVSSMELEKAERRLKLDRMSESQRARIGLFRGSLVYEDTRLEGYDAITLIEVIEHIDPERLDAVERVVFERARPGAVIVSTPNAEYNALFDNLAPGAMRHADHRFEWTRAGFEDWVEGVCARRGYTAFYEGIGAAHADHGHPTQMAVFQKGAAG
ncbi:3' terminal RNA ribose 2'-O-methyltransferase Hen1 [Minwuia sp.]|uniref:3' terminal RNA ribose 2'-O-methyltransferase Hen1 n=1 Tax=Minwuia sp. TaxID=2493630 RepID=UPI003A91F2C9